MSRVNTVSSSLLAKLDEPRRGLMAGLPFPVNWIVATPYMAIAAAVVVPCAVVTGAVAGLGEIVGAGMDALRNTPTPERGGDIANIAANSPKKAPSRSAGNGHGLDDALIDQQGKKLTHSRPVPVPPKKKAKTPQVAKQKSAGNGRGLDDTLIKRQRMKEQQKKVIKHNWNEPVHW